MADNIPEGFVDVSKKQNGGVLKKIVREGDASAGSPCAGDKVFVHYVGTLYGGENNGQKFDSSRDRNSFFDFSLLEGQVIKAWDEGVSTMKKGELCELICKPEYAYGAAGSPPAIPPNSTLKFEVELFRWEGEDLTEDKDGGVRRSRLESGEGYAKPSMGSTVIVNLVGKLANQDNAFDERSEVKFDLGDGTEKNICSGIEIALKQMNKGEKARLTLAPKYAFGSKGKPEWNVPADAEVTYEVTLTDFEAMKEPYEYKSAKEKIAQAEILKEKGTTYFKKNNFKLATHFYEKSVRFLQDEGSDDGSPIRAASPASKTAVLISARLNLALVLLKTDSWSRCIDECNSVLSLDPKNEKALFRKAQAEFARQNYEEARQLFLQVTEVNPENKAAQQQATLCHQKIKSVLQQEKNLCRNMFSKLGKAEKGQAGDNAAEPTTASTNGDAHAEH